MKRPPIIYAITVWLCLGLLSVFAGLGRLGRGYEETSDPKYASLQLVALLAFVCAVWLVIGLVRLRPVARWVSVSFFGYWTIYATVGASHLMHWLHARHPTNPLMPAAALGVWLVVAVPNILSIVYLSRRKFREFAGKYVEQSKREALREHVETQARKNDDQSSA